MAARAAAAAAATDKLRAKKEAQEQRSVAKQQARGSRAEEKKAAKAAKLEAKNAAMSERKTQVVSEKAEVKRQADEARERARKDRLEAEKARAAEERRSALAAAAASTADDSDAPDSTSDDPVTADETKTRAKEPALEKLEATQPIGRVQVDDAPAAKPDAVPVTGPKERSTSFRTVATMAAAALGIIGLVFSVILAVGALIVAMGAGEGNALYEPISRVCNVLAGPLKDAFDFTGPSAASREEFLGWGAGSLIYLALSFAGQAGHRALTRS